MKTMFNDPLLSIGRVIIYITMAMIGVGGLAVLAGLVLVLVSPASIFEELNDKVPIQPGMTEAWLFAGSFALVLVLLVLLFFFFRHMLRIVNSVGDSDPFAPINAARLQAMAWLMVGVQVVAIPTAGLLVALTTSLGEDPGTVDAGFDPFGVVLVITLFILARVFRHGAAMREDLEGTI